MNSSQVIKEFDRFLSGSTTIDELKEWVFSHLQEALDTSDVETIRWMDEANVSLMEINDGFIDEEEFMESIDAMVRESETVVKQFSYPLADPQVGSGEVTSMNSESVTIGQEAKLNLQVFDLLLSPAVFG